MLPFLRTRKRPEVVDLDRSPDREEQRRELELQVCAEDLLSAIKTGNTKAIAAALKAAYELCAPDYEESESEFEET